MNDYLSIEPVDSLHLRGNKLFSDGHGTSVMPPWPSLFAGALRSRILVDNAVGIEEFKIGLAKNHRVSKVLGRSPQEPGTFQIWQTGFCHNDDILLPLPADLVAFSPEDGSSSVELRRLEPIALDHLGEQVKGSFKLPFVARLPIAERRKPLAEVWIDYSTLLEHLKGNGLDKHSCKQASELWTRNVRVGIGLDSNTRSVKESLLYTTDSISLKPGVSFFNAVRGSDELLPKTGLLRLGGDGKGARIKSLTAGNMPGELPWNFTPETKGFRMVLASPGIFPNGWLPPGVERTDGSTHQFKYSGLVAELKAAIVPRAGTISGWDLAKQRPKTAHRVVPRGAVYWFETISGDQGVLQDLAKNGLSPLLLEKAPEQSSTWLQRKAEGFNNVWFGNWNV